MLLPLITAILVSVTTGQDVLHTFIGDQAGDAFGEALSTTLDMDGDGLPELIIGAFGADSSTANTGSVRVVSPNTGAVLLNLGGMANGDRYGAAVAGLGDVDGDSIGDLAIGAPFNDTNGSDAGLVEVRSGATGALLFVLLGAQKDNEFGASVARIGDLNGDGVSELAAGAPNAVVKGKQRGLVRVHSGVDGALLFVFVGKDDDDRFGEALAGVGDMDGDGVCDIAVGAPSEDGDDKRSGVVHVFSGADGGSIFEFRGVESNEAFGGAVAWAGDLDGDGIAELLVGANSATGPAGEGAAGRVRVFRGGTGDLMFEFYGPDAGDHFGRSVACGEDVDGDGVSDLLVGADQDDTGGSVAGTAWVFSGSDGTKIFEIVGPSG
ncbi:MAG: integrin alpha, partial [bacterium]